jgi:hypothetical protein
MTGHGEKHAYGVFVESVSAHSALHRPILPPPRREPGAGPVRYWQCAPTLRERDCELCGHSRRLHRNSRVTDKAAAAYRSPSLRVSKSLMPMQPLPGWHRTSKFLLWGHGLKIPQLRSIAALPHPRKRSWVATCTAAKWQFPSFAPVCAGYLGRQKSMPGISDLIDDKVGGDSHARQITHVRVNENTRRIELVIAASMRRLAHRPPRAGGRRVLP